jgi:acetylglutamate kinase
VNKSLVSLINVAGGRAVGICGKDGNTLRGRVRDPELGFVGDVTSVDVSVLRGLLDSGAIPVVATVAMDASGQALNVNADTAAGELAASLGAAKLILMTDVPGVCTDKDDPGSLLRELTISETRDLVADGARACPACPFFIGSRVLLFVLLFLLSRAIVHVIESDIGLTNRVPPRVIIHRVADVIAGGMIPKVECCVKSIAQGVKSAHIIDGRAPHSLLLEILTDEGAGTMITG